jgi:hypothetical protein
LRWLKIIISLSQGNPAKKRKSDDIWRNLTFTKISLLSVFKNFLFRKLSYG